jgi:hypothetical protein
MTPARVARIASALAVLAATPALATSLATARMENFTYELRDLDPLDGIAPSIVFGPGRSLAVVNAGKGGPLPLDFAYGESAFAPTAAALTQPDSSGSASVADSATGNGIDLVVSGRTDGTPGDPGTYGALAHAAGVLGETFYLTFELSANTVVTFKATASVSARTTIGLRQVEGYGDATEYASASAFIFVRGPSATGTPNGRQDANDQLTANVFSCGFAPLPCDGFSIEETGVPLAATFLNLTTAAMTGELNAYVSVNGVSHLPAVPEPAEYALLGLGLTAVTLRWGAARRKPA